MSALRPAAHPPRVRVAWWVGVVGAVVVVVVAAVLLGGSSYRVAGDTDPGRLTTLVVSLLRLCATVSGSVCVGALVFAVLCTVPRGSGRIDADGYAAVLRAGRAAGVWTTSALLLVGATAVDSAGKPLSTLLRPGALADLIGAQELPKGWLVAAVLAGLVAVGLRFAFSWSGLAGLAVLAALALLPPPLSANAAEGAGHDINTSAIVVHVVAAAVYLGTLLALLVHVRRGGGHASLAARRYTIIAGTCWVAVVLTGVVLTVFLLPPTSVLSTSYGVLTLAVVILTVALGGLGVLTRRRLRRAVAEGSRRSPLAWAGLDLTLLVVVMGASEAAARQPAPVFYLHPPSVSEVLLGYPLPVAPDLGRLLTLWRPDLVLGPAAVLLALAYLLGARRVRGRWPWWRTASFTAGCVVLLLATCSGVNAYAHATFSVHMGQHMALNMVAAPLLVVGAPFTLVARALPAASTPGPREWLLAVARAPLVRALTHPVGTLVLYAGTLFGIYLTPAFEVVAQYHWAHLATSVIVLGTGYLFFWPVLGIDEGPARPPHLVRLGMLVALMFVNAVFGVVVTTTSHVLGGTWYTYLSMPWVSSLAHEQQVGGLISWLGGEVPMLLAAVVLLVQWSQTTDADDGPERTAPGTHDDYADMVATLARGRR
ncbi:MAG: cytochrome c oxidase assembly protein [Mycobacteriaceae bacterium]